MEVTPSQLPRGPQTEKVTLWNLQHRSYLIERTSWTLPNGPYTMEVT